MAGQRVGAMRTATVVSTRGMRFVGGVISGGLVRRCGHVARLATSFIVFLASLWLQWGAGTAFLLGLLVASVLGLVGGRWSVAAGLVCLACSPILLIGAQHAWLQRSMLVNYYISSTGIDNLKSAADTLTMWAYYFLGIGLVGLIRSYVVQHRKSGSVSNRTS